MSVSDNDRHSLAFFVELHIGLPFFGISVTDKGAFR